MLKKSGFRLPAMLLLTGISMLLGGCLVDKKDPSEIKTISRNGEDSWHIYQPDEWIEYNLQALDPATGITTLGILRVDWESTSELTDPTPPNDSHSVLKETTTITYDGSTSPDVTVIRYISQITDAADPNQGRIFLHAIDDGQNKYWPFDFDLTTFPTSDPVITPVLFDSPMDVSTTPVNTGKAFSIAQCDVVGQCNPEIYHYRDDTMAVVSNASPVESSLGNFNDAFKINFGGSSIPQGAQTLTFIGDLRDACGTIKDTITHGTSAGLGSFYVFPGIGIIRIENTCQLSNGDSIYYTATIRNTNINY